jgi:hypothetical protein
MPSQGIVNDIRINPKGFAASFGRIEANGRIRQIARGFAGLV